MNINQKDADMMRNAIAFSQESLNTFNVIPSEMGIVKDEELISSTANTINHFENYTGLNEILEPNKVQDNE
jgi:hypothetical protein